MAFYEADNLTVKEYDNMTEKEKEDFYRKAKKVIKEKLNAK